MKSTKKINSKAGFTLLEILLVVGIISILAGIVILAINPTKQLGDTRDAQRRADVLTILNAIYQYAIDPGQTVGGLNGVTGLSEDGTNTCSDADTDALDLDADLVGTAATYLTAIPTDPTAADPDTASEYYVHLNNVTNRITVCAPNTEQAAEDISVTR